MKKILYLIALSILVFLLIANSNEIMNSIRFSFSLCINNLFPSLIPFMLLSNILINCHIIEEISELFSLLPRVFKVSKNCSFVIFMSLLSGTPSNAKYLYDLSKKELISEYDIQKCLTFCHFTNPIFVVGTIGVTFLNSKALGIIILLSHYLSTIIIGFVGKNFSSVHNNASKSNDKSDFFNILKESVNSTINTLLLTLGIITTSIMFTTLIDRMLHIPTKYKFIYGIVEITQGLKYLSYSNVSVELKAIISSILISFGGLSVHAQVFSIIDNKKIRYKPYLVSRLLHAFLASILCVAFIKMSS